MRVVYLLLTAIHFVKKQARGPLFFIAFLKCSKHNYQVDQVLENFKYSFHFEGITLSGPLPSDHAIVKIMYHTLHPIGLNFELCT